MKKKFTWYATEAWIALGQTALLGCLAVGLAVVAAKIAQWMSYLALP